VTVTNSIYRIFIGMLTSRAENIGLGRVTAAQRSTKPLYDHIHISEIISDAIRNHRAVVMTFIDRRDVFELVNYDHLLSVMTQLGLPDDFVAIACAICNNVTTLVDSPTGDPVLMNWTRGLKPGCPLSSILPDICFESFLRRLVPIIPEIGYTKDNITYHMRLRGNQIVFRSNTMDKQRTIIGLFQEYCVQAKFCIDVAKCSTASVFVSEDQSPLTIFGHPIPVVSHLDLATSPGFLIKTDEYGQILSLSDTFTRTADSLLSITQKLEFGSLVRVDKTGEEPLSTTGRQFISEPRPNWDSKSKEAEEPTWTETEVSAI
jgi:hypothetical protein